MPTPDEVIEKYAQKAEETRKMREALRQRLLAFVEELRAAEGFEEKARAAIWRYCSEKNDQAALRKANGWIPPKKQFLKEVRESEDYQRELTRLNYKDPNYIEFEKALKHPENFLSGRAQRLFLRILHGEEKKKFEALLSEENALGISDFVEVYLESPDWDAIFPEFIRAGETMAEEALRSFKRISRDSVLNLMSEDSGADERELFLYGALGVGSFAYLCEFAVLVLQRVLPRYEEVAAIAEALDQREPLFLGLQSRLELLSWDRELAARLLGYFDREKLLALLLENPNCPAPLQKKIAVWREGERKKSELRYNIVTAMPETYQALYPATRAMRRHFILHAGPTNSGKTYAGMQALMTHENGVYLGPLRMLALEKADEMNEAGFPCSLRTGEEERLIPGARFTSSTVELADFTVRYACAVIDECQMMTDPIRGGAWTAALLGLQAEEIHVCLSPWALETVRELIESCEDSYEIQEHERATPLTAENRPVSFPGGVRDHDALVAFSRRSVHAIASRLEQAGKPCSIIYGNLPYDVRENEARKFRRGETKILVATDAIGMGLNLPIRRVVFMESEKFDGRRVRGLESEEIRQIAGRAGRRGIFKEGYVSSVHEDFLKEIAGAVYHYESEHEVPMFGFPRQLLGIDSPVSVLMQEWMAIPPLEGFRKADLSEPILLAREAERYIDDKSTVFSLAMIPFDSKEERLLETWLFLTKLLARGQLAGVTPPEIQPGQKLLDLELQSKIYDLYFHFGRLFDLPILKEEAMAKKEQISRLIMKVLEAKGKEMRKCSVCGSPLPWNSRFTVCDSCHRLSSRRYYRPKTR